MKNEHKQYVVQPKVFDAYPKNTVIQTAKGSLRVKSKQESEMRSTNFKGDNEIPVSAYRLTRRGIQIANLAAFIAGAYVTNEIVSGSGTSFTLANVPVAGPVALYGNGVRLTNGVDFSYSGTAITILIGTYATGTIVGDYYT